MSENDFYLAKAGIAFAVFSVLLLAAELVLFFNYRGFFNTNWEPLNAAFLGLSIGNSLACAILIAASLYEHRHPLERK